MCLGRDMIHYVHSQANWDRIKNNKQKVSENSNKRETLDRIQHEYNVGDHIIYYENQVCDVSYRHPGRVRTLY
jgi:hypothetical protein